MEGSIKPDTDKESSRRGGLQLVLLVGVGLVLGLIWRGRAFVIGLLAVSGFPAAAIAEVLKDPTTHNLFPFELAIYGVFGLVVATGAVVVRLFRRMLGHSYGR